MGNLSEPVGNFTIDDDDDARNEEVGKPQVLLDKRGTAYAVRRKQSLRARYIFGFIFFTTNLLAWFFRDYGYRILHGLRRKCIVPLYITYWKLLNAPCYISCGNIFFFAVCRFFSIAQKYVTHLRRITQTSPSRSKEGLLLICSCF